LHLKQMTVGGRVEGTGAMDGGEKKQAQQEERHRNYVTIPKRMCGGWVWRDCKTLRGEGGAVTNRISKKSEDLEDRRRVVPLWPFVCLDLY
jgi:hypothetical protein